MRIIREFPPEIQDPNTKRSPREKKELDKGNNFVIKMPDDNKYKKRKVYYKHALEIKDLMEMPPKVSLSGKKDIESVVKWMKEHMKTYPETHKGFLVDFIDDNQKKGYKVSLYYDYEVGETKKQVVVSGVKYNII